MRSVTLSSIIFIALLAVCGTLAGGCESKPEAAPVLYADRDDPEMNGAIAKARDEMGAFESALNAPSASQSKFGVKVPIPHAGGVEHVWLAEPKLEADSVVGIVEQTPMYATNISAGTPIRVDRAKITDWMYLEDGKLKGGYTMRVAIARLPESERMEQRKALGIDD